jgi:hypothetical protein
MNCEPWDIAIVKAFVADVDALSADQLRVEVLDLRELVLDLRDTLKFACDLLPPKKLRGSQRRHKASQHDREGRKATAGTKNGVY